MRHRYRLVAVAAVRAGPEEALLQGEAENAHVEHASHCRTQEKDQGRQREGMIKGVTEEVVKKIHDDDVRL